MKISCVSGTVEGRLESLKRMVLSIRRQMPIELEYEIVLVAGACSNKTLSWIRDQPDCVLIEQTELLGGIIAYNSGCRRSKGEYVLILNDDIVVDPGSITKAAAFLDQHPEIGQVAFGHKYQKRRGDPTKARVDGAFGYLYGQCCMTRRWLGDQAGWWGNIGMKHYAGDAHLGMRIWELGYKVVTVPGCTVTDFEVDDEVRRKWSDLPRQQRQGPGRGHPDSDKFVQYWRGRLPPPESWKPAVSNRVIEKAMRGTLRTLLFKAHMGPTAPKRVGLLTTFQTYGPSMQANQTMACAQYGLQRVQQWFLDTATRYQPDLIMLQAQRANNITAATAKRMVQQNPNALVFNWDGDTHYPMEPFQAEIARAVPLQLTISPDLFPWYRERGAHNIGYWPIGTEPEYLAVNRNDYFTEKESHDVIFLGSLYGEDVFPEAVTRRDAIATLATLPSLSLLLHGHGWRKIGLPVSCTVEEFEKNAILYSQAKMGLSISQTAERWGYTSDRTHNILATGCPLLMQRFSGHKEYGLIDGENCIIWDTIPEMVEKASYYKAHPQEREAIGRAGRELVRERYTWPKLVEELWGLLAPFGGG